MKNYITIQSAAGVTGLSTLQIYALAEHKHIAPICMSGVQMLVDISSLRAWCEVHPEAHSAFVKPSLSSKPHSPLYEYLKGKL